MKKILLILTLLSVFFVGNIAGQSLNFTVTGPLWQTFPNFYYHPFSTAASPTTVGTVTPECTLTVSGTGFNPPQGPAFEILTNSPDFRISQTSGGPYYQQVSIPLAVVGGNLLPQTIYIVFQPTTGTVPPEPPQYLNTYLVFKYAGLVINDDDDVYLDGYAQSPGALQEMEITGDNGNLVPSGSTTPSLLNGTDFGTTSPGVPIVKQFTIHNTGGQNLVLTQVSGTYVYIGGRQRDNFTVTAQPALTTLTPGQSTTFDITFSADLSENYEAYAALYSNDPASPYTFAIAAFVEATIPTLEDPSAAYDITTSQAKADGEVTGDGGAAVEDRGMCWKVAGGAPPTIANFKSNDGGFGLGQYSATMTNLQPETSYWYRAYATNTVGTAYAPASVSQQFWTLSREPSAHPATFTATPYSTTQINLAFSQASSIQFCDGYLILMKEGTYPDASLVADGVGYIAGQDLGSGTIVKVVVASTTQTTAEATGLSESTEYCFSIIPYNWNLANSQTYNYLNINPQSACATTSASTTTWNGTGFWNTPENWSNGIPGANTNAIIAQSDPGDPLVVNSNVSCNDLTIQQGAYVTINTGRTLTVNGNLLMESNANGSASLITNGTLSVTGSTTVNQYLPGNRRSMVSTPTTGSTYATLQASPNSENDFYRWDEPTCYWIDLNNGDPPGTPLQMGEGYHVLYNKTSGAPATKQFTGPMNNSNVSPPITYSGPTSYIGWNLVGNPFPCAVDWDVTGWIKVGIQGTIYAFNGQNYSSWNGSSGSLTGGILPPMQGFFVKADGSGSYSLTIPRAARLHDPAIHYKEFLANLLELEVKMEGSEFSDATYINFNSEATNGFDDAYDGYKLPGIYLPDIPGMEESFQLYSIIPGDMLSINVLPPSESAVTVPLGFEPKEDGTYTFIANELESFEPEMSITLEDLRDNVITDLKERGMYEFTASPSDAAERFLVHFSGPYAIKEIPVADEVRIWSYDRNVYVSNENNLSGEIVIYNIMGQEILRKGLEGNLNLIGMTSQSGYYIVRVITDQNLQTEKVFIR